MTFISKKIFRKMKREGEREPKKEMIIIILLFKYT